ncbi:methyltransferase domain-containing protein [Bacillus sp. AK128]
MTERIILFGASKFGIHALQYLDEKSDVLYFCDNDSSKWGTEINGIKVIPPSKLKEVEFEKIIITSSYANEISKQLFKMNIRNYVRMEINFTDDNDDCKDLSLYSKLFDKNAIEKKQFFNIGAGTFKHKNWTNVDYSSEWYSKNEIDIQWNLLENKKLDVEDSSAHVVYTSHTIEHIPNASAQNLFNEAFRVLKKGGIFRATTPNIELDYSAFKRSDRDYYFWIDTYSVKENMERAQIAIPMNQVSIHQIFLHHFASQTSVLHSDKETEKISDEELEELFNTMPFDEALDYCISKCSIELQSKYPGNHINWWNANKLIKYIKQAGFQEVYLSGYGQSKSPVLRNTKYFDNTHPKISLYVEAIK